MSCYFLDGSADDLLTCHRLANLVSHHSCGIQSLVAMEIDTVALKADPIWLAQSLHESQIERYEKGMLELPPVTRILDTFNFYERISSLNTMQSVWDGTAEKSIGMQFDINEALRRTNALYDEAKVILEKSNLRDRRIALQAFATRFKQQMKVVRDPNQYVGCFLWRTRAGVAHWNTDLIMTLTFPALDRPQMAEDRSRMRRDLLKVGFPLARYRARHARYPERLDELQLDFLKQIPEDIFVSRPLNYKVTLDGYLLYSVGDDESDDGGKPVEAKQQGDIVFEVKHKS